MLKSIRSAFGRLSTLHGATQLAVLFVVGVASLLILFWVFNQFFYYLLARSYVEEIANAYDLNKHLAQALVWISFALIVVSSGYAFSLNSKKRMIGGAGVITLLALHSLVVWNGVRNHNFTTAGDSARCYVVTRTSIKTLNRTGIDPETGLQCLPITPQIAEKIKLYQGGKKPTLLTATDPDFFDRVSGEPIVWHAKTATGAIELFDLMGFHPRTGEELTPVDRQVVNNWKAQNERVIRRVASRVDPDKTQFFDPTSGSAKVWYFVLENGDYEFYDGPGYHARTGEPLKIITRETIDAWKAAREEAARKKRIEDERIAREARERAERDARERAQQEATRQAEAEVVRSLREAGINCDRLAANPTDARKTGDGVPYSVLLSQADQAIEACTKAVQQFPNDLKYQYQLGRALQTKDRKKAFEIFSSLVRQKYPAAYDNLGNLYWSDRNDAAMASQMFANGANLSDPDSMVSLALMIDRGQLSVRDPINMKIDLLRRAAELGHRGAQASFSIELEKARRAQIELTTQQQNNQRMLEMMGSIIGGAIRR